jgi:hypothetical protein
LLLEKWFIAIEMMSSDDKGVSAKRLQRELQISYETAWTMAHRIRVALAQDADFCKRIASTYSQAVSNEEVLCERSPVVRVDKNVS